MEKTEKPPSNPSSFFEIVNARIRATRATKRIRKKIAMKGNMQYIRKLSKANMLSHGEKYDPKVSERFLEEWLDFPRDLNNFVLLNTITLMTKWLLWTNKSIASLDPASPSIRDRLSNTIAQLSTASGLILVMSVACFTIPPEPRNGSPELQRILLDAYGVCIFTSMVCSLFYIGYALTALYPVLQSMRDDLAFDGYEHLKRGLGGYELYMFNVGMHALAISFYIAGYLVYSFYAFIVMVVVSMIVYALVLALTRDMFINLDPISALHLGLSNDPLVLRRAELMAQYILRQIPNHLLEEECVETRASLDLADHQNIHQHLEHFQSDENPAAYEGHVFQRKHVHDSYEIEKTNDHRKIPSQSNNHHDAGSKAQHTTSDKTQHNNADPVQVFSSNSYTDNTISTFPDTHAHGQRHSGSSQQVFSSYKTQQQVYPDNYHNTDNHDSSDKNQPNTSLRDNTHMNTKLKSAAKKVIHHQYPGDEKSGDKVHYQELDEIPVTNN